MSDPWEPDFEVLRNAALEITREWDSAKMQMALRAVGLESADGERETLDAIAAEFGVSRETVRRARNQLLHAIKPAAGVTSEAAYALLSLPVPPEPSAESPATVRALRRLLTITGPLPWDEVLNAWSRAGGKPPYSPLPDDEDSMIVWTLTVGGFSVIPANFGKGAAIIAVSRAEELDQVGQFLLDTLHERSAGITRNELLSLAAEVGLKSTTIATALSVHPAVVRVSRGVWTLRGKQQTASNKTKSLTVTRRSKRAQPTTFTWGVDGSLLIEFSIPYNPSPVVAVPKAISAIIEGQEFLAMTVRGQARITVKNAKLWGFGAMLSELRIPSGARATIALDLLMNKATLTPAEGTGPNE